MKVKTEIKIVRINTGLQAIEIPVVESTEVIPEIGESYIHFNKVSADGYSMTYTKGSMVDIYV